MMVITFHEQVLTPGNVGCLLGPHYSLQNVAKEMFIVTKLFIIAFNDFDANKYSHYSRVIAITKLVMNGTQCN